MIRKWRNQEEIPTPILYTVDATKYVTVQTDATFHEGRGK